MNDCRRIAVMTVVAGLLLVASARSAERQDEQLATPAAIQRDARQIGEAVRRESNQIAREVTRSAHEFKQNVKHWWEQMRSGADRAGESARARLHSA